jgi:hypothetical protein
MSTKKKVYRVFFWVIYGDGNTHLPSFAIICQAWPIQSSRYQLVGLTSYARFGYLDSDGSNILEVVTEHINRKRQPLQFFGPW